MSEYKPLKMTINHSDLPSEMLLFRDFEQMEEFAERYRGIDVKRLGRLAISQFRGNEDEPEASDMDYFGIGVRDENTVTWHLFFEHYPEIAYFTGLHFTTERKQLVHQMLRVNDFKTFQEKFGWAAQVVVDELPSEEEREAFCEWLLTKRELDDEWEHFDEE